MDSSLRRFRRPTELRNPSKGLTIDVEFDLGSSYDMGLRHIPKIAALPSLVLLDLGGYVIATEHPNDVTQFVAA